MLSLAEQSYIAYAKKILERIPADHSGTHKEVESNKVHQFLSRLDSLMIAHPEFQYPPYYKAKLLLALGGQNDAVFVSFIPFAQRRGMIFGYGNYWRMFFPVMIKDVLPVTVKH